MLIDIKYHIITIISLFITLAIGILIGSTIVGTDPIIKKQHNLISNLEKDFISLRKENKRFKSKINKLETKLAANLQFKKKFLPLVVNNKLKGEKILIVNGKNVTKELEAKVTRILKMAGIKKLEKLNSKTNIKNDYTIVLLIGNPNEDLAAKCSQLKAELIKVSTKQLASLQGIIKFIFELRGEQNG